MQWKTCKYADGVESRNLIATVANTPANVKEVLRKSHHRHMTDAHVTPIITRITTLLHQVYSYF